MLAPKGLPVAVQPLSGGRAPEGSPAVPAPSDSGGCKVAPGMEAAFTVTFCPEAEDDFACSLLVVTEREMFEVPVRGVGAAWVAGLVGVMTTCRTVPRSGIAVRGQMAGLLASIHMRAAPGILGHSCRPAQLKDMP